MKDSQPIPTHECTVQDQPETSEMARSNSCGTVSGHSLLTEEMQSCVSATANRLMEIIESHLNISKSDRTEVNISPDHSSQIVFQPTTNSTCPKAPCISLSPVYISKLNTSQELIPSLLPCGSSVLGARQSSLKSLDLGIMVNILATFFRSKLISSEAFQRLVRPRITDSSDGLEKDLGVNTQLNLPTGLDSVDLDPVVRLYDFAPRATDTSQAPLYQSGQEEHHDNPSLADLNKGAVGNVVRNRECLRQDKYRNKDSNCTSSHIQRSDLDCHQPYVNCGKRFNLPGDVCRNIINQTFVSPRQSSHEDSISVFTKESSDEDSVSVCSRHSSDEDPAVFSSEKDSDDDTIIGYRPVTVHVVDDPENVDCPENSIEEGELADQCQTAANTRHIYPSRNGVKRKVDEKNLRTRSTDSEGMMLRNSPKQARYFDYQTDVTEGLKKLAKEDSQTAEFSWISQSSSVFPVSNQKDHNGYKRRAKIVLVPVDQLGQIPNVSPKEKTSRLGRLVWAKLGSYRPWPAMIVDGPLFNKEPAALGHCWVFWLGEHKVSQVSLSQTLLFIPEFRNFYQQPKQTRIFNVAVQEALTICCQRCNKPIPNSENDLLNWALDGFRTDSHSSHDLLFSGGKTPQMVMEHLQRIGMKQRSDSEKMQLCLPRTESVKDKEWVNINEEVPIPIPELLFGPIRDGTLKLEDVCIACDGLNVDIVAQHPLFKGGLCQICQDCIKDNMFLLESDGDRASCSVCSNGGEAFVCSVPTCGRVYCIGCVEIFIGLQAVDQIRETEDWTCFMCAEYSPETHGLLESRADWRQNVLELFGCEKEMPKEKGPIRVLSLFDGIGTARLILDQLGLDVEVYYACEIDEKALSVTRWHFRDKIIQLGDVTALTDEKINALGRIDLLIGGSPCNDISLCNPLRKGLYNNKGTGHLFFQFVRVLAKLKTRENQLFWLFENVAFMKTETKVEMSQRLECSPARWDAKNFSAQERARFFWGNIPGLYGTQPRPSPENDITLQDMLNPAFNRKALVEKIRTVTTNSNSLLQRKDRVAPIIMNSAGSNIWIQEVEKIFGFPVHYTDVCNLNQSQRQALLGKSWSVPVVQHLLSPLRDFFSWKPVI